ncbi:MAG: bifunctional hydroxymethylpyrimidine kinase/phosphomethylpyrimidine kinase [Pseudomonadota bacterium]
MGSPPVKGRVLIIAGSDSGGGAGIQADIKTVTALGGYAATAITALTIQDTSKVHGVIPTPAHDIAHQIQVVMEDIGADCIKVGMLGSVEAGRAVFTALQPYDVPIVVDPVLVATSGDALGGDGVAAFLRDELIPMVTIVTPNASELSALTGLEVSDEVHLETAAAALLKTGVKGVLAKAGHMDGGVVRDLYLDESGAQFIEHPRLRSRNTHGTGCTLASAVAAGVAQGLSPLAASRRAVAYVTSAIQYAPGFGKGHGPLNHALRESTDGTFEPI